MKPKEQWILYFPCLRTWYSLLHLFRLIPTIVLVIIIAFATPITIIIATITIAAIVVIFTIETSIITTTTFAVLILPFLSIPLPFSFLRHLIPPWVFILCF